MALLASSTYATLQRGPCRAGPKAALCRRGFQPPAVIVAGNTAQTTITRYPDMMQNRIVASLVAAFAVTPAVIHAASLGEIDIHSRRGEPLKAQMEVTALLHELPSLAVRLAPPEVYAQYGLPFPHGYRFVLQPMMRDNRPSIALSTAEAIRHDQLVLLVQLQTSEGRVSKKWVVAFPRSGADVPKVRRDVHAEVPAINYVMPPRVASSDQYQVQRGDTLSGIARKQANISGANIQQVMAALYHANEAAFVADNANRLKAGVKLRLPSDSEIRSADGRAFASMLEVHAREYAEYRKRLAAMVAESLPDEGALSDREDSGLIGAQSDLNSVVAPGDRLVVQSSTDASAQADNDPATAHAKKAALDEEEAKANQLSRINADIEKMLALRSEADLQPSSDVNNQLTEPSASPVIASPMPAQVASVPAPSSSPAMPGELAPVEAAPLWQRLLLIMAGAAGTLVMAFAVQRALRKRREAELEQGASTDLDLIEGDPGPMSGSFDNGGELVDIGPDSIVASGWGGALEGNEIEQTRIGAIEEAEVYMSYGRHAQADELLCGAIETSPDDSRLWIARISVLARAGHFDTAVDLIDQISARGFGDDIEQEARQTLEQYEAIAAHQE